MPVTARPTDGVRAHFVNVGTLAETAPMRRPRAAHTATPLVDGRVLVAGGFVTKGDPAGAELYDPATGRFDALPAMVHTRHSHTATRMSDGTVLIAGGYSDSGEPVSDAELFDPRVRRFVRTASMAMPRAGQVAVLLGNGSVLVAGGVGPDWRFLSSAELYDPTTKRWQQTGEMTEARESHAAVRLLDGRVLIVGGHRDRRSNIVLHASTEIYDVATGRFRRSGTMQVRRHKHDVVMLRDGRVLVTGGSDERDDQGVYNSTELFDPATERFTMGPTMLRGRYKHAGSGVLLPDGSILLAGGAVEAERFDAVHRAFTLVEGSSRMAGQFSAAALLRDGGVLITGGYGGGTGPRATAWRYRP
jgi:hypothetical protein